VFQFLEQARQQKSNPEEIFKQVTNKYTPEQMNALFDRARQFGIGDDIIQKLKNWWYLMFNNILDINI